MQISRARILVTGANGFIGGALADRLAQEGAQVRVLVRQPGRDFPSGVEVYTGDITDAGAVDRAVDGCAAVVHAATRHITQGQRQEFYTVNVQGTENLLRAFARQAHPPNEGRFVHISTINVHGFLPPRDASADSPLCYSGDYYSDSKVDGEKMAQRVASEEKIPLAIVRPACTYGPRGRAWTLLPLERLRANRPVLIGRGDGIANAVYVDDVVEVLVRALECETAVGEAFIASAGAGVTWREFYGAYAKMLGGARVRSIPYWVARSAAEVLEWVGKIAHRPAVTRKANIEFYSHRVVFDIGKTRRLLGWDPRVSFEEGMARTEKWLRDNGKL